MKNAIIIILITVWTVFMMHSIEPQHQQRLETEIQKADAEIKRQKNQREYVQAKIISDAKNAILDNENKETKSFMIVPEDGNTMRTDTKREIINFAEEHGWAVSSMDGDRGIVFEKKGER